MEEDNNVRGRKSSSESNKKEKSNRVSAIQKTRSQEDQENLVKREIEKEYARRVTCCLRPRRFTRFIM